MAKRRTPAPKSLGPAQLESEIFELLSKLPDPPQEGKRHYPLDEILFLVIAGVLSGLNDITGIAMFGREKSDWLRESMPYENGPPSHDTIGRVLGLLCPDALEMMFSEPRAQADGPLRVDTPLKVDTSPQLGARGEVGRTCPVAPTALLWCALMASEGASDRGAHTLRPAAPMAQILRCARPRPAPMLALWDRTAFGSVCWARP